MTNKIATISFILKQEEGLLLQCVCDLQVCGFGDLQVCGFARLEVAVVLVYSIWPDSGYQSFLIENHIL